MLDFTFEDLNKHWMNFTIIGKSEMIKVLDLIDHPQEGTNKTLSMEILLDRLELTHIGKHELQFMVSDVYSHTNFTTTIEFIDITAWYEAPNVPELAPFFISPPE